MEYHTSSPEETTKLAEEIGHSLKGGETLALVGDLGSGKTTFMRGLAKGLGVSSRVMSPTFVIMREHQGRAGLTLYHIDLYRLEENIEHELDILGICDTWSRDDSIVAIEWADRAKAYMPDNTIWIEFVAEGDTHTINTNYETKN